MVPRHIRGTFQDILQSERTRPSPATWIVRLVVIAAALSAPPSSMLDQASGHPAAPSVHASSPANWFGHGSGAIAPFGIARSALPESARLKPALPFHFVGSAADRSRAIECLAAAGWYEAGDDLDGQRSVMQVVLNRARHPAFPSSICGVVFQGSQMATGCQFTFTCDGSLQRRHPSQWEMRQARKLAAGALDGAVDASVGQATHYHADYVDPWWSANMQRLGVVGLHIFYRWPGQRGSLSDGRSSGSEGDYQTLAARATSAHEQAGASVGSVAGPAYAAIREPSRDGLAAPPQLSPAAGPASSAVFMTVDSSALSGGWALAALAKCSGRRDCQVIGYQSSAAAERNRMVPANMRERPVFLFLRDGVSGMDVALWDCDRVQRPSASQCLPAGGRAMAELMRERTG
jgi:hypothetical protein